MFFTLSKFSKTGQYDILLLRGRSEWELLAKDYAIFAAKTE